MQLRKIVIATDSFKGSMTSLEAASGIEKAVLEAVPGCEVVKIPMADGGEGTLEALAGSASLVRIPVSGPLGEEIQAEYAIKDGTAVIEMAKAAGLTLVPPEMRNPMETSTYGVGQMIRDAGERGCRKFIVGIGGSATNDGGIGMLRALGWDFGVGDFPAGKDLLLVKEIDDSRVPEWIGESEFTVACDVDTPFCGAKGAAYVFAPQKGADEVAVAQLDAGMWSFAKVVEKKYGVDITGLPGAGAAGGLGGAFTAFLKGNLKSGIDAVLDAAGFNEMIKDCDLVFTGEGKMDGQTVLGKVPAGVLRRAAGVPVIALAGKIEDCTVSGFLRMAEISAGEDPAEAMKTEVAKRNIYKATKAILLSL
ncbi:MAG: glycerate kinase [Bacteroidales bacterium]|nr:glycerate kinase [Bacteroidales bacterium]